VKTAGKVRPPPTGSIPLKRCSMSEFANATWLVLGSKTSTAPLIALGTPHFAGAHGWNLQIAPLFLTVTLLAAVTATARLASRMREPKSRSW